MGATHRLGFAMTSAAGHATHAQNMRRVAEADPTVQTTWIELRDHVPGGWIERVTDRVGSGQGLRPLVDLVRGLRWSQIDALLTNWSEISFYPRRLRTCPVLIDFDSTHRQLAAMPAYGRQPSAGVAAKLRDARTQRFWSDVHTFIVWSEWAKAGAVDDYGIDPDRVVVNPPGVDLDLWAPAPDEESVGRPTRVLFVGGDFVRKGGDLLVDWFRTTRPVDTELHLVTGEAVESTPGVVVHTDLTPNSSRLIDLYRHSDVFALPTRAECFGLATVEAMAVGLPVVVGDVGASSEIVEQGGNGLLVRPGHAEDLADALGALLDDESQRQRMGRRSRMIAERRFDLMANAAALLDVVKQATVSHR